MLLLSSLATVWVGVSEVKGHTDLYHIIVIININHLTLPAVLTFCCIADTRTGNCLSGSPLTQALVYAQHHNCPDAVDGEIIQLLMDTELDINVFYLV